MKKNEKEVKKEKKAEVKAMTPRQLVTLALREFRKSLNECLRKGMTSEVMDIIQTANDSAETIYRNKIFSAKFAGLTQDELDYLEILIKANHKEEEVVEA